MVTPTSEQQWRTRLEAARALVRRHHHDAALEVRLDGVTAATERALADRAELADTVGRLDPARASADLKAALRNPDATEQLVTTLRRRHQTVHDLANRLDMLDQQLEVTVADVESLAARAAHRSSVGSGALDLSADLDQLQLDIITLHAAHEELS